MLQIILLVVFDLRYKTPTRIIRGSNLICSYSVLTQNDFLQDMQKSMQNIRNGKLDIKCGVSGILITTNPTKSAWYI